MKVLHIITSLDYGGAEISLLRLIENSLDHNHLVICLSSGGPIKAKLVDLGCLVFTLNLTVSNFIRQTRRVNEICKNENISVITSWLYHADFFTLFLKFSQKKTKILWTVHNLSIERSTTKTTTRILVKFNSFLSYFVPNEIVYCAESSKLQHQNIYNYDKTKGITVFNGPLSNQPERGANKNNFDISFPKVGMSARWDPIKNHSLAIEAIAKLIQNYDRYNNLIFILCGQNIDYENTQLCNLISRFSLEKNVRLMGTVSNMETFYQEIDVLLLTSVGEALPNVIIEALYLYKPIVSTDVGDVRQVIGKCGEISESNSGLIAEKLDYIFENYEDYENALLDDEFTSSLDRFKIKNVVKNYKSIWYDL